MTGSVIDGEDVLQEALLKAHAALEQATSVQEFDAWLFRIAHNAALDYLRRRRREQLMVAESADMETIADSQTTAESRQIAAEALRAFMHLSLLQRSTCILVDVLGLSLDETSAVVDSTLAGTKAALHRGRARLAEIADKDGPLQAPAMSPDEERRLRRYIDRFNARDFDAIRAMIGEDVRLDLVNRLQLRGKARVSNYFSNYNERNDWSLSLGFVEGRPAILVYAPHSASLVPWSFMLIDWAGAKIAGIRDFRYAPYVLDAAHIDTAD
jgi:RNA polymerase sigma-70 factor (ECF subfamily)